MSFLLRDVLLKPSCALTLDNKQLHQLISEARSSRLLATLAIELEKAAVYSQLDPKVTRHLRSEKLIYKKQKNDLAYDLESIQSALKSVDEKLVLLKGAAYITAELPVGRGRLITDIDIIVRQERLDAVECALKEHGWTGSEISLYDDRYYRKWGHEIPALTNVKRGTTLDVHHNILPPTVGIRVDAKLLLERLIEVKPGIFTLSWQDMVIHSATHLFHEGEFHNGLRDLWDLDQMLRSFPQQDPNFWSELVPRASELGLLGPIFHALNYSQKVFNTPLPTEIVTTAATRSRVMRKPLMDFLFVRAFRPDHANCKMPLTALALHLLYIRSHYLRMPLRLLIPHLARKAWTRNVKADNNTSDQ